MRAGVPAHGNSIRLRHSVHRCKRLRMQAKARRWLKSYYVGCLCASVCSMHIRRILRMPEKSFASSHLLYYILCSAWNWNISMQQKTGIWNRNLQNSLLSSSAHVRFTCRYSGWLSKWVEYAINATDNVADFTVFYDSILLKRAMANVLKIRFPHFAGEAFKTLSYFCKIPRKL